MLNQNVQEERKISRKSWFVTLILCLFTLGFHRIYVGKIGTGLLWLVTSGGFFVGLWLDFYKICTNQFTDKEGAYIIRK
ncbi:MAG: TM2 domain-containing protein [Ruminococcaceae bacterium]|nr:TM2 domain-containing protein [Oscillospiraceae bacterium]